MSKEAAFPPTAPEELGSTMKGINCQDPFDERNK
jgi:hypothetical protein